MDKVEKKPVIRVRTFRGGVYAHNYKGCLVARTKREAIEAIKEAYPGDYEIQDIVDRPREETSHETSDPKSNENVSNPS